MKLHEMLLRQRFIRNINHVIKTREMIYRFKYIIYIGYIIVFFKKQSVCFVDISRLIF